MDFLAVVFALVATALFFLLRWRVVPVAVMFLAVFEGALRKWVIPEYHQVIYLVKDVLIITAFAGLLLERRIRVNLPFTRHPATLPIGVLTAWLSVQLLNPGLPITVGLFGLRAYLVYIPLLYILPAVFRTPESLQKFWRVYLLMALIPLLLGPVQFSSPITSVWNRYAWPSEDWTGIAGLAGYGPRITGTFSYISGYSVYLQMLAIVILSILLFRRREPLRRYIVLAGLLMLVVANLWMTGSRGPFVVLAAAVPLLILLAFRTDPSRWARSVTLLSVTLVLAVPVAQALFPEAYAGFMERAQSSQDVPGRLTGTFVGPFQAMGEAGLFGYGVGTTHQAVGFLGLEEPVAPPAEGELQRIVLETGPLGLLLVLWIRLSVVRHLWRTIPRVRGTAWQPYVVAAFLFTLLSVPGNLVFNHTHHLFYWFMAGTGLAAEKWCRENHTAEAQRTQRHSTSFT